MKLILEAVSAVQWKFIVSAVHLEELWRVSERARLTLPELIENSVTLHRREERERFDATRHLEALLFQARSFIDVLAAERRPSSLVVVTLDERLEAAAAREGFPVLVPGKPETPGADLPGASAPDETT